MYKRFSVCFVIISFIAFTLYILLKKQSYKVIEIKSPTEIVVDFNKNNVADNDEIVELSEVFSFSTKPYNNTEILLKSLNITLEDALRLGYLAEKFANETLENKTVKVVHNKIIVDSKDYQQLLLDNGLGVKRKNPKLKKFLKTLEYARKLDLVIYNNKSQKYHKLTCKYGLLAHNSQIIFRTQVGKEAKPCKFCLSKKSKKSVENNFDYFSDDFIPDIKAPPMTLDLGYLKVFLSDMTRTAKPDNVCKSKMCQALVSEINSANESIDFAIYGYTKIPKLENALKQAMARGVNVRFVYDTNKNTNIYSDTFYLSKIIENNNFETSISIMHNKFFVIDKKVVFTGSANISNTDMSAFNSNCSLLIKSEQIANDFEKEFNQMYLGKFHSQKKKFSHCPININGTEIDYGFSLKDKTIQNKIIPLIDNAKNYVYIPTFILTHKELTDSLIKAHQRGVKVKIILDATNSHAKSHSKIKELRLAGIPVKTEVFAGKLHSKTILIDDTYTIVGSMNLSKSGESKNDENVVIIKNSQVTVFYKKFFEYLWTRIPNKWLKYSARAESPESIGSCRDGIDNDFGGKIDSQDDSCKIVKKKKSSKTAYKMKK
ncbi:MAG: phosphatidylserine/phosphatidylglycerophosphate/cardiolipin synthase family protein [bacterium]|nr:phosphatidylserine/phosphatidylglycerophosphate/cardiolipin synthase family protein [bacterium]